MLNLYSDLIEYQYIPNGNLELANQIIIEINQIENQIPAVQKYLNEYDVNNSSEDIIICIESNKILLRIFSGIIDVYNKTKYFPSSRTLQKAFPVTPLSS